MSPDAAIRARLIGTTAVTDLVPPASISCAGDLPEETTFPAITCMVNANAPEAMLNGPSSLRQAVVEIQCYAVDQAAKSGLAVAKAIGAAVQAALESYRGVLGDLTADGVFTEGPADLEPDREAGLFGVVVLATVWFH